MVDRHDLKARALSLCSPFDCDVNHLWYSFGLTRERNVDNVEDWEPGVAPDITRFSIYIYYAIISLISPKL